MIEFQVHNLKEDRDTYMKYFESLKSQTSDFGIGFTVNNYLEFSDELVTTFPIMYKTYVFCNSFNSLQYLHGH